MLSTAEADEALKTQWQEILQTLPIATLEVTCRVLWKSDLQYV